MSERLRQSLSALMDDAADDLELGRILRAMDEDDPELRETWSRYHMVSAVMRGQDALVSQRTLTLDEMLEQSEERRKLAGESPASLNAEPAPERRGTAAVASSQWPRPWRAMASFAVAASVTAVAVVGWQWQAAPGDAPTVAASGEAQEVRGESRTQLGQLPSWADQSAGVMPAAQVPGEPLVLERTLRQQSAPFGGQATAGNWGAVEAVPAAGRMPSVELYLLQHAEKNALHSGSGMMPFARMAAFEGAR